MSMDIHDWCLTCAAYTPQTVERTTSGNHSQMCLRCNQRHLVKKSLA